LNGRAVLSNQNNSRPTVSVIVK